MTTSDDDKFEALSNRLIDHADGITNAAAHEMEKDIRLAADVVSKHSRMTTGVREVAAQLNQLIA